MHTEQVALTIHQVAERTGVSIHTLRAWERRYGVPQPDRIPGNRYRLYNEQDIADILWMKHQLEAGLSPSQASLLLQQQRRSVSVAPVKDAPRVAAAQVALESALVEGNDTAARDILDQAWAFFSPEQVAVDIIQPTLQNIGSRWESGQVSVWQEHQASHLILRRLDVVLQAQPPALPLAPLLITACAPDEDHEIGLVLFTFLAQRQGWRTAYLGPRTPLADLAAVARDARPAVLAISVTTVSGLASLLPWLGKTNPPPANLVFGGRLSNAAPGLREHLPGGYLGQDAVTASRALVGFRPQREIWSPPTHAWAAVEALQNNRYRVAGETISEFLAQLPVAGRKRWNIREVNTATQYLIDTLVSALAFEVPELVDMQREWLENALSPRRVPAQAIAQLIQACTRVLDHRLSKEEARRFQPLLDRLAGTGAKP